MLLCERQEDLAVSSFVGAVCLQGGVHISMREQCRSTGLDNWLVLECQMAEEGIMAGSSCCHGGVRASNERGGHGFLWMGPSPLLTPPPCDSGLPGPFVMRGWEPRNLAESGWPSSTSVSSALLSLSWPPLFYIPLPRAPPPRVLPSLAWLVLSWLLFFSSSILF